MFYNPLTPFFSSISHFPKFGTWSQFLCLIIRHWAFSSFLTQDVPISPYTLSAPNLESTIISGYVTQYWESKVKGARCAHYHQVLLLGRFRGQSQIWGWGRKEWCWQEREKYIHLHTHSYKYLQFKTNKTGSFFNFQITPRYPAEVTHNRPTATRDNRLVDKSRPKLDNLVENRKGKVQSRWLMASILTHRRPCYSFSKPILFDVGHLFQNNPVGWGEESEEGAYL